MAVPSMKNVRIGDILKEYGYVTEEQITEAMAYQKENKGMRLGGALIALGMVTEKQMLRALATRLNLEYVEISDIRVNITAVEKIPRQLAENYCMLGVDIRDNTLVVVMNDPLNFYGIEDVRQTTGLDLSICLTEKDSIEQAISYYYSEVEAKSAADRANESFKAEDLIEDISLEEGGDDTPVVSLLNSLLQRAYSINASDIHIEPYEDKTLVRMRVDGVIMDYVTLQKGLHASLIARIKILAELDIAERRIPQDGHFRTKMEGTYFNVRVSTIPTVFGEKAVMRLLVNNAQMDYPASFGMSQESFEKVNRMLQSPNGIIYVTGPTGSGKSTTLYMILEKLSQKSVNISTIEDPVEKNLPKLNQMQVNTMAGLTFEVGLRALLRQDPDIIMIGETRDAETASIAVRAAITGHMVFSTLHTNDAASSVVRLADMGLENYMIASSLVGVIAQRLMRKLCPECSVESEMTEQEEMFVGRKIPKIRRPKGCAHCSFTGYKGRIAIHEILEVDGKMRRMITDGAEVEEIKQYARTKGMKTLKEQGIELIEKGITSVDELTKVAYYDE